MSFVLGKSEVEGMRRQDPFIRNGWLRHFSAVTYFI